MMKKYLIIPSVLALVLAGCGDRTVERLRDSGSALISEYVSGFNASDEEIYVQEYPNSAAEQFMQENIPLFECPDKELEKTWYFRWWTFRKHVKATPEGYIITEFLPDVSWAGKYNAICCPASHHFNEGRWLNDPRYLKDYAGYWCREKDDARRYSFPVAYSFLQFYKVHPDMQLIDDSYPALKDIYAAWEGDHLDPNGLFWQTDNRDGMEISISGALGPDISGYRATINSYMYADATALSTMATMLGKEDEAALYASKAEKIKGLINTVLWDREACFYKVIPRGCDVGLSPAREEHGYVPWIYGIPEAGFSDAWLQLTDTCGFKAPFGPTTAERRAEGFKVVYEGHACQWNGPSWPFATAQTLTGLAAFLHRYGEGPVTRKDYYETLSTYSNSHRMVREDGSVVCWIDENQDPFTGEWLARRILLERGYQYRERGKDYNHSSFCDLIVSGLIGIEPQLDGSIVIEPLIPEGEWDYFSLSRIPCAGKDISVVYDRTGEKYHGSKGLTVYVDGKRVAHSDSYETKLII